MVALATDRQCNSISSTRTSLVSSMPSATMARLSPTSTMSMPAASATCADGKSCAVMTAMGSLRRCIARSVPTVTFLRWLGACVPSGECELCLLWPAAWERDSSRGLVAAAREDGDGRFAASEDAQARRAVGKWHIIISVSLAVAAVAAAGRPGVWWNARCDSELRIYAVH